MFSPEEAYPLHFHPKSPLFISPEVVMVGFAAALVAFILALGVGAFHPRHPASWLKVGRMAVMLAAIALGTSSL